MSCPTSRPIRTPRCKRSRAGSATSPGEGRTPQLFRLFGYAGTGKTTLARHLAAHIDGEVKYAAFTGKAALVMRAQGLRRRVHDPQPDLSRARERRGDADLRTVGRRAGLEGEADRDRRMLDGRCRAGARPDVVRRAGAGARRSGATAAGAGRRLLHRRRAGRDADRGAPAGAGRSDRAALDAGAQRRAARARRVRNIERRQEGRVRSAARARDRPDPGRAQQHAARLQCAAARAARLRRSAAALGRQAGLPAQQPPQGAVQRRAVERGRAADHAAADPEAAAHRRRRVCGQGREGLGAPGMLHRQDRGVRLAAAQEIRRVRFRLRADRAQGAGLAVGRRRAVRRVLRVSRQPRALALYRHHAGGEAAHVVV